uniref:Uncharacterized protein n=1 Tax=Oryza barthii TaxID=65489 RepID=A0A0D3HSQ9_9ORYZ
MLPFVRSLRRLGPAAADGRLLLPLAPLSSKAAAPPPEYEMPSVTWGVIQGRKERLVSREAPGVSDPVGELEAVELPSSLEVLQEGISSSDFSPHDGREQSRSSSRPHLIEPISKMPFGLTYNKATLLDAALRS